MNLTWNWILRELSFQHLQDNVWNVGAFPAVTMAIPSVSVHSFRAQPRKLASVPVQLTRVRVWGRPRWRQTFVKTCSRVFSCLTWRPGPRPAGGTAPSPAPSSPASVKSASTSGSRRRGPRLHQSIRGAAGAARTPSEPRSAGPPPHSRTLPRGQPPASPAGSEVQMPPCPPSLWPGWSERGTPRCGPVRPTHTVPGGRDWHKQSWGCLEVAPPPLSSCPPTQTAGGQRWARGGARPSCAGCRRASRCWGHDPGRPGLHCKPAQRCCRCPPGQGLARQAEGRWWTLSRRSPGWPGPRQENNLQISPPLSGLKHRSRRVRGTFLRYGSLVLTAHAYV